MFNTLIIGVDGRSGGEDAIAYEEFLRTSSRRLLESVRSQAEVDAEILVASAPTGVWS